MRPVTAVSAMLVLDVVTVRADGRVEPIPNDSVAPKLMETLVTDRRDYAKVKVPAFAIYAATFLSPNLGDSATRQRIAAWETQRMVPFRVASQDRIKRELTGIRMVDVPGTHMDFVFRSRDQVVAAMREFLDGSR